jgi:glycosyltransferase involved in cell wall biosynthesis
MSEPALRVLLVAEHASLQFGGEAALPLHYYRVMRARGMHVWLVVHERTRAELQRRFPQDTARIVYIPDTAAHRWLWKVGKNLPDRLSYFTTGFVMRTLTQVLQRRLVKALVAKERIDVVHQPIPVSPKEPSMIHGVGAPVVIGPMNGGMAYPPAFKALQSAWVERTLDVGKALSGWLNRLVPGKPKAALLLVANERTRKALPPGVKAPVARLVENGVDLSIWRTPTAGSAKTDTPRASGDAAHFVFVGRLVDWKAVDLLLHAFAQAQGRAAMSLTIIGDGPERASLEALSASLALQDGATLTAGKVRFLGWMSQPDCAAQLAASHALVLPSLNECGGAVVLEAMAIGRPVIATDWGGPADYLDPQCGILVPPTDRPTLIQGLADALVSLAQSPQMCESMGQHGREKVLREFDWEIKVDRMIEFYQQAIGSRPVAHPLKPS